MGRLQNDGVHNRKEQRQAVESMLQYGAFPEPFLAQDQWRARIWRRSRVEQVIREDLRDLSRIPDLSRIEMLASLIPERVSSPLSRNSLREDLEVSHSSVTTWMDYLRQLYYVFDVRPYHRSLARALRKEPKIYLSDFSEVSEPGARFENFIASHLLKACDYWTDNGYGTFSLRYLRTKERREIDFLILRDNTPWLPVEAKLSDQSPSPSWKHFLPRLGCGFALQIVRTEDANKRYRIGDTDVLVLSASQALGCLV
jgi:hypothetical protein